MIKKLVIGTLAMALIAGFVLGRDCMSYARTLSDNVRDAVKSEIDVEFEVQRARDMVDELVPEIQDCMRVVISQQVDLKDLERKIAEREDGLNRQREAIVALRSDLRSGKQHFTYARISYTRDEVERDLEQRFERFQTAETTLNRDKQILMARRDKLRANQQTLERMLSEKQNLEVAIEELETRLEQVQAEETVSSLEIDDSQLARARSLIADLHKKLDVREAMMDAEGTFPGLIPVEAGEGEDREDIGSRVDAYFNNATDDVDETPEVLDPAA